LLSYFFLPFKDTITAVHADGNKFTHPLNQLGKSASDLPLLVIDSFKHMFVYPDFKKITYILFKLNFSFTYTIFMRYFKVKKLI
jgi:hypothetical protein